jgi:hypothetical protein
MGTETVVQAPAVAAVRPSDDEILGITSHVTRKPGRVPAAKSVAGNGGRELADVFAETPAEVGAQESMVGLFDDASGEDAAERGLAEDSDDLSQILDSKPELRSAWNEAKEYRAVFATPAEARAATKLLGDLNRMDALFFSKRPEDHAELARHVAQLDPAAFASLARAMTEMSDGATTRERVAAVNSAERVSPRTNGAQADAARNANANASTNAEATTTAGAASLTPAQSDFFQATNAQAVQGVMEAIEAQVERLLPEGISEAARNRVAGEIYREMDTTLQGNRALGQQMRDAFRSGALDDAHRKAIVSLVTSRAKQALPAVAKRVLNEWTNTIVSANQDRRARQRNAERRVEISGSGGNDGRKAISSRDIDYRRMSDGDILNL